ncbi:tRNA (adenine(22)-N(1))-methyltransferase [Alkaliphilus transvaalensis]|uniref:tRNA (adenine(22)-N(1))-methyltransferase n=1 Tax=Alkaliphilus transvaalensis TaxID=114628 RepID=UPI00047C1DDC|nr:class I SAM-dependent methyltransferase [Alkaliphilus transvaalensis]
MQVKLTPRLEKIACLVKEGSRVADIGTDHGYIPLYLLENKISTFVIASDVNQKPLESAEGNIKDFGYENQVETRLGSGLETLKVGEVDTVIIAGMGGLLIADLLKASPDVVSNINTFILQPMQAQEELRRYLIENGYSIKEDLLVKEDHRIYEIIVVEKGKQLVDKEIFYMVGFHLKDNPLPLAEEFIERKIKAFSKIFEETRGLTAESTIEKNQMALSKLKELEEVLEWLKD